MPVISLSQFKDCVSGAGWRGVADNYFKFLVQCNDIWNIFVGIKSFYWYIWYGLEYGKTASVNYLLKCL